MTDKPTSATTGPGFRVWAWGLGFRIWGSGSELQGLGAGLPATCLDLLEGMGLLYRIYNSGFGVRREGFLGSKLVQGLVVEGLSSKD